MRSPPIGPAGPAWRRCRSRSYVYAGGVAEDDPVHHADDTSGTLIVTDGPYAEAKEFLGGVTLIRAPDDETAKRWAGRLAEACGWPQEVRRLH